MKERLHRGLVFLATAGLAGGCITTTAVNISQKTSLERQLIGEFEPFTDEELLAVSVRSQREIGRGTLDDLQQRAIAARRRQLFNRDDVGELLTLGCLGESAAAQLARRECEASTEVEVRERITRVLGEENTDRGAIIDWALAVDPVLTPDDRGQIVAVYTRLLRERLVAGQWYEGESGWKQK